MSGMAGAMSGFGSALSGIADVGNMISSFLPTSTTSNFSGQTNQTTQKTDFSEEAVSRMINQLLQSSDGLQSLTQGQQSSGLFNSSTNQMLVDDFLARVVGEVGKVTSPVITDQVLGPTTTKQKSKKCFITTAAVEYAGQADDGDILETLRNFRDSWVAEHAPMDIVRYYKEAPAIVECLKKQARSEETFKLMYEHYILAAVREIRNGQYAAAYQTYRNLFNYARKAAYTLNPRS